MELVTEPVIHDAETAGTLRVNSSCCYEHSHL